MYRHRNTKPAAVLALLALASAPCASQAVTRTALPPFSTATNVLDEGFEAPDVGTAPYKFLYAPLPASGWALTGNAGIAENGSAFGNATAPQGNQVLILQNQGTASRTFSLSAAETFTLVFQAAQRPDNRQRVQVHIDGVLVGEAIPRTAAFEKFTFDALKLTAGSHTLVLTGMTSSGDQTLFVDSLTLNAEVSNARRWSNPATWGGTVPQPGDSVVIPANAIVLLDTAIGTHPSTGDPVSSTTGGILKDIDIQGQVHCADQDIQLAAESIMVHGRFVCGSPHSRYVNNFILTLRGTGPDTGDEMGTKVLAAMGSGAIELHGEDRQGWTQLAATAAAGASQATVLNAGTWRLGDSLVLAPTAQFFDHAELVNIKDIVGGTTLKIDKVLAHPHYGAAPQTFNNGVTTWTLDERGEVGLLSRNIRIQGDFSSTASKFGGHIMAMAGTTVHVSGVELYRMGQFGVLRRYPFHWHLAGNAPGQYIRNSSIHESYNRCVTVHGTNDVLVADNVCYDFIGHGYFLEDGNEQRNTLDHNLAVHGRLPGVPCAPYGDVAHLPLETDCRQGAASYGPAGFWISNPTNTVTNNAVAGAQGTGYWYHTLDHITGDSAGPSVTMNPMIQPFGLFENNRVHSSAQGLSTCVDGGGPVGMLAPNTLIKNLTISNVLQGIWPCAAQILMSNSTFQNVIVANATNGLQSPSPLTYKDSLFVGYSNNPGHLLDTVGVTYFGVAIYDHGFSFDNVHFVNYDRSNMTAFFPQAGAYKLANNRSKGLTFANVPNRYIDFLGFTSVERGKYPSMWGDVVHDLDGSFVGKGRAMVSHHPMMSDATCSRPAGAGIDGYACPYRYANFILTNPNYTGSDLPYVTILRSDGMMDTGTFTTNAYLNEFMVRQSDADGDYTNDAAAPYYYSYRFEAGVVRGSYIGAHLRDAFPGDVAVHEILDMPPGSMPIEGTWTSAEVAGMTTAQNLQNLKNGPGHRYYYRPDTASLYLKFLAPPAGTPVVGEPWYGYDPVSICLQPLAGGTCNPLTPSTPAPPQVRITTPDRFTPSGSPSVATITTEAQITSPTAIVEKRLFINDAEATAATPTANGFTYTRPQGVYVVKFVVKNAGGYSYTALQRIVVGEPEARVATTTPQNATFDASQLNANDPIVNFSTPATPSPHLHWIDNKVDQGDVFGSALPLSSFAQGGRHDVEIAMANPDESVTPIRMERTVYIMRDNVLADFDTGVDTRLTHYIDNSGATCPYSYDPGLQSCQISYGEGYRLVGPLDDPFGNVPVDSVDRYNYVDFSKGIDPSRLRLALTPLQNWQPYSKIRVRHNGVGYSLVVAYDSAGEQILDNASYVSSPTSQTFSLPGIANDKVKWIEFRERTDPGCGTACNGPIALYSIELLP